MYTTRLHIYNRRKKERFTTHDDVDMWWWCARRLGTAGRARTHTVASWTRVGSPLNYWHDTHGPGCPRCPPVTSRRRRRILHIFWAGIDIILVLGHGDKDTWARGSHVCKTFCRSGCSRRFIPSWHDDSNGCWATHVSRDFLSPECRLPSPHGTLRAISGSVQLLAIATTGPIGVPGFD